MTSFASLRRFHLLGTGALPPPMIARDKGLPVKALGAFLRNIGRRVRADSQITGPALLKSKKPGCTAGSLEAPLIDAFLAPGGRQRSDVERVHLAASSANDAVGRTDRIWAT